MAILHLIHVSVVQHLSLTLGLALWQQTLARPQWLTYAFLVALIVSIIFFLWRSALKV